MTRYQGGFPIHPLAVVRNIRPGIFNRLIFDLAKLVLMTTHQSPKKSENTSHLKEEHAKAHEVTPSGISSGNQSKIAVVILIIMVITTGMIFFGLI